MVMWGSNFRLWWQNQTSGKMTSGKSLVTYMDHYPSILAPGITSSANCDLNLGKLTNRLHSVRFSSKSILLIDLCDWEQILKMLIPMEDKARQHIGKLLIKLASSMSCVLPSDGTRIMWPSGSWSSQVTDALT